MHDWGRLQSFAAVTLHRAGVYLRPAGWVGGQGLGQLCCVHECMTPAGVLGTAYYGTLNTLAERSHTTKPCAVSMSRCQRVGVSVSLGEHAFGWRVGL